MTNPTAIGNSSALRRIFCSSSTSLGSVLTLILSVGTVRLSYAVVATGSELDARKYYAETATTLEFSTPVAIFSTTLDNVAAYLGYGGLTGRDLQDVPPTSLMSVPLLTGACVDSQTGACSARLKNRELFLASLGPIPPRPDDILATRFFAPKIMNINLPEDTRPLGWRGLVRLRARDGSPAKAHHIASGIILFNFFTEPGTVPFGPDAESVNTQVMLLTERSSVPTPGTPGPATLYWLDYDAFSKGGTLSLALEASFDATELQKESKGVQKYFVPDGCNACHGMNKRRPMVNYLDTDHWFDRLETDFQALKVKDLPLLVDAATNDRSTTSYKMAFDVIRRFNNEAEDQARQAQPIHDEVLAGARWLTLHAASNEHFDVVERAIGATPNWSKSKPKETEALSALNQYCFRCHGTIKFSVFNKQAVLTGAALVRASIDPTPATRANPNFRKMPPDRDLPADARDRILGLFAGGAP